MIDNHTKKDIEKHALEILKASKSLDTFPTPVDKIVSYAELAKTLSFQKFSIRKYYFPACLRFAVF